MSKTEDERLGLGWEVWFLVAGLAAGAVVAIQVVAVIGAGFDVATQPSSSRGAVGVDLRRLLVGGSAAVVLAGAAIRIILTTNWVFGPSQDRDASPQP